MNRFSRILQGVKLKLLPFTPPIAILSLGLLCIFHYVLPNLDFEAGTTTSITILVSTLGFLFAVFQVVLNIIIQGIRNKASLRHTEYKEMLNLLNTISDEINKGLNDDELMTKSKIFDFGDVLKMKQNLFRNFIVNNNTYLFKGIQENKVVKDMNNRFSEILIHIAMYHSKVKAIENSHKHKDSPNSAQMEIFKEYLDFHNRGRELFVIYNDLKHPMLREMQRYLL
ncbi:hypothetical protein [Rufibacter sp. LB8]|uniref:hypothetical protein n=1 Tax=Rufibacter sp. LB8 TaxID=2777781 RepID=UPI00178C5897|nr:hypothetical protein [Rufibacter sp. LB8]